MVEQTANAPEPHETTTTADNTPRTRVQSEIEFPYSDLEATVELAHVLYTKAGSSCDDNELAAWLNQSSAGGTYRARRSAARMFGLIDIAQGKISLTDLGRDLSDNHKERDARIEAFLKPELHHAMYEKCRGHVLPPASAIERQMEQLGVSPKQKARARQVFHKSAIYAGFIDQSSGRFIKPGNDAHRGNEGNDPGNVKTRVGGGGNGGDGDQPDIDPIIHGLLARLPKSGAVWPDTERKLWLDLLAGSFKLIYKDSIPSVDI